MTQQELEALLAQIAPNGQPVRLEFTEQLVTKKVKRKVPSTSEFRPDTEEEVEVRVPTRTWVDRGTGRTVTVEVNPDGTYTKMFDGIDPKMQGAAATKPEDDKPAAPPKEEANPSDPTRMRRWNPKANDGQGGWEDAGPNAAGVQAQQDRNKPGAPTLKPDGKGGTVAVQTMPDGSIKTTPLPGVPSDKPTPDRVTVDGTVYERGPDGAYAPAAGLPTAGTIKVPEGAPQIDTTTPQSAFDSYQRLLQWVDANVRSGKLKPGDVEAVITAPHKSVEMILNRAKDERTAEQTRLNSALTQRSQDMTQSGNRLTSANSQFQTALTSAEKVGQMADPGQNATAHTLLGTLALQALHANAAGGMRESAPVVPGPVANLPPYRPPVPQSPAASAQMTPEAASAVSGPPAIPMTPERVRGMMQNPAFRPPPPVSAPPADLTPVDPRQGAMFGAPVMALASSFAGGGNPYQGALDSLKASGIGDDVLEEEMRRFGMGGVG